MKNEFVIADVLPGKLNALVKNIMSQTGSEDPNEAVRLVNSGEWIIKPNIPELKIWKTIKIGTGIKTADDFRKALKKAGCKIGDWGNDILGKPEFKTAEIKEEIDLVNISVAELGFKKGATRKDIYDRALQLGLEFCPAEVGPQLRLQYPDQPLGEWLLVAMEPITDSDGTLYVFDVECNDDGRWLNGNYGNPDYFWGGDYRWVFCRPRK
ncbi:hypothetical protein A2935_02910 [Candidatus Wolfebacteria bacterium RIFCSPLOWO2_01_FULL_47_17b]|uniref:Uncharacterized protein n=1 Tax=Candidatus Wolfebacteria bacterium RIFCSPLOWO2_01_FULL_47_17b TaxID=1802558 RepID=A0A1F8DYC3_9BACT|nr:MAG: hypothetical protein A2935_02910 [Candidatus Wolfebacteria bacterium RIFCSPLOWO2_01_FULL_47_17b]